MRKADSCDIFSVKLVLFTRLPPFVFKIRTWTQEACTGRLGLIKGSLLHSVILISSSLKESGEIINRPQQRGTVGGDNAEGSFDKTKSHQELPRGSQERDYETLDLDQTNSLTRRNSLFPCFPKSPRLDYRSLLNSLICSPSLLPSRSSYSLSSLVLLILQYRSRASPLPSTRPSLKSIRNYRNSFNLSHYTNNDNNESIPWSTN